jgi:hypothetical protein
LRMVDGHVTVVCITNTIYIKKNVKLHTDCAWRTCNCVWPTCVKSGDVISKKSKNPNITI